MFRYVAFQMLSTARPFSPARKMVQGYSDLWRLLSYSFGAAKTTRLAPNVTLHLRRERLGA